jgi:hypothetical protein
MRKPVATKEGVERAVHELTAEGLTPTVDRVRTKVGGGSFSTIGRLLNDVLAYQSVNSAAAEEIPATILDIGQRSVAAIYAAVTRDSTVKINLIEAEARRQVEAANHARSEATLEIERLEQEAEQAAESIALAEQQAKDFLRRAEISEARVQSYETSTRELRLEIQDLQKQLVKAEANTTAAQRELEAAQKETAAARKGEQLAREEAAELRGQLKARPK